MLKVVTLRWTNTALNPSNIIVRRKFDGGEYVQIAKLDPIENSLVELLESADYGTANTVTYEVNTVLYVGELVFNGIPASVTADLSVIEDGGEVVIPPAPEPEPSQYRLRYKLSNDPEWGADLSDITSASEVFLSSEAPGFLHVYIEGTAEQPTNVLVNAKTARAIGLMSENLTMEVPVDGSVITRELIATEIPSTPTDMTLTLIDVERFYEDSLVINTTVHAKINPIASIGVEIDAPGGRLVRGMKTNLIVSYYAEDGSEIIPPRSSNDRIIASGFSYTVTAADTIIDRNTVTGRTTIIYTGLSNTIELSIGNTRGLTATTTMPVDNIETLTPTLVTLNKFDAPVAVGSKYYPSVVFTDAGGEAVDVEVDSVGYPINYFYQWQVREDESMGSTTKLTDYINDNGHPYIEVIGGGRSGNGNYANIYYPNPASPTRDEMSLTTQIVPLPDNGGRSITVQWSDKSTFGSLTNITTGKVLALPDNYNMDSSSVHQLTLSTWMGDPDDPTGRGSIQLVNTSPVVQQFELRPAPGKVLALTSGGNTGPVPAPIFDIDDNIIGYTFELQPISEEGELEIRAGFGSADWVKTADSTTPKIDTGPIYQYFTANVPRDYTGKYKFRNGGVDIIYNGETYRFTNDMIDSQLRIPYPIYGSNTNRFSRIVPGHEYAINYHTQRAGIGYSTVRQSTNYWKTLNDGRVMNITATFPDGSTETQQVKYNGDTIAWVYFNSYISRGDVVRLKFSNEFIGLRIGDDTSSPFNGSHIDDNGSVTLPPSVASSGIGTLYLWVNGPDLTGGGKTISDIVTRIHFNVN